VIKTIDASTLSDEYKLQTLQCRVFICTLLWHIWQYRCSLNSIFKSSLFFLNKGSVVSEQDVTQPATTAPV
jgi:hypothetical protein